MKPITASKVLFIKLGEGGGWEEEAIKKSKIILGFRSVDAKLCFSKQWSKVADFYRDKQKLNQSTATRFMGEIKHFFEEPEDTLWITFHNRKMYWAFAHSKVDIDADGRRVRHVIGKWSDEDILGNQLTVENLIGSLTVTQGYRSTICRVKEQDYVVNKINSIEPLEIVSAKRNFQELVSSVEVLIKRMNWKDFEILVDLIFRQAGWQRLGVIGKTEKDIDLDLISPVTNEKAFVQIKSESDYASFQNYVNTFKKSNQFHKFFFVVHSTKDKKLLAANNSGAINIWHVTKIAELSVNAGLYNWIIKKSF